jgi:hypothetical protein
VTVEQLVLFADPVDNCHNGNGHVKTKTEVGLAKVLARGPEPLLTELVKRGLEENAYGDAALVLALEEAART